MSHSSVVSSIFQGLHDLFIFFFLLLIYFYFDVSIKRPMNFNRFIYIYNRIQNHHLFPFMSIAKEKWYIFIFNEEPAALTDVSPI